MSEYPTNTKLGLLEHLVGPIDRNPGVTWFGTSWVRGLGRPVRLRDTGPGVWSGQDPG